MTFAQEPQDGFQAALMTAGQEAGDMGDLSLVEPKVLDLSAITVQASLVQIIHTSLWSPPSTDPSGIVYFPSTNKLIVSDSEVNETPYFEGVNVWESTLNGEQVQEFSSTDFSDEPSGIAYNSRNQHLFFTDDSGVWSVYELDPGADGLYDTLDDIVTSFRTSIFSSQDPEGITYDPHQGHLFIVDGKYATVYEIDPGANDVFDGVPPDGDDLVDQFDTAIFGVLDPEGIAFNPDAGTLFIIDRGDEIVVETTRDGSPVRVIDLADLNVDAKNPAGVAYGPNSTNALEKSLYIVDRGVDNDLDPDENDGKIYEISLGTVTPSLVIDDVVLQEGDAGTSEAVFTVTLSSVSVQTVTVDYSTLDGSATMIDYDYVATSGRLSIQPFETTQKITVLVNGDRARETDETFFVNLSNATNIPILVEQGTGTIIHDDGPPQDFQLKQNFPNPFNPTTQITYTILRSGYVRLNIYDQLGREVQSLVSEFQEAGTRVIDFDASALPAGIYLYTLRVGDNFSETQKMLYLK